MTTKRNYSLFVQVGGKWRRISPFSWILQHARQIYQNSLLAGATSGLRVELRPVTDAWEAGKSEKVLVPRYDEEANQIFLAGLMGGSVDTAVEALGGGL